MENSDLWMWSAGMNGVLALTSVGLGIRLTRGAGFSCWLAFIRFAQRVAFMALAVALLNCGLHSVEIQQAPPAYALVTQLAFMFALAMSAVRHFYAPSLPTGANWRNRPRVKIVLDH